MEQQLKHGVLIFDEADASFIAEHRWSASHQGYARTTINGVTYPLHRLLMDLDPGDPRQVDHANGNRLDNRRCNLRICTVQENRRNVPRRKDNTSGYKGVIRVHRKNGMDEWRAVLAVGGFASPEEAAKVYDTMAETIYGEFAYLNFPPSGESSDSK
jgi:hypothetical protein